MCACGIRGRLIDDEEATRWCCWIDDGRPGWTLEAEAGADPEDAVRAGWGWGYEWEGVLLDRVEEAEDCRGWSRKGGAEGDLVGLEGRAPASDDWDASEPSGRIGPLLVVEGL